MTHPSRADAHHNMGALLLANEEYKKALIELNKAISIDPLDANFRHTRAWALWRLKQTQQALDELKFAINLSPEATLLDSLGSFLYMLGDYDEALRVYSKAISKASSSAEAAVYLRKRGTTFFTLGKIDFALVDLNKAIEISPGDVLNFRERSAVYEKVGRIDEAIEDCNRALVSATHDAQLHHRRGQCYFEQDKFGLALEDAQAAIRIDPQYSEGHLLMGRVLLEDGQVSLAMQFFVTAFTFDQQCADAYLYLAVCFDLLKSHKEAHQYARKAAVLDGRYKKYTLEATRHNLITAHMLRRMQTFSANVHQFDPDLLDDEDEPS